VALTFRALSVVFSRFHKNFAKGFARAQSSEFWPGGAHEAQFYWAFLSAVECHRLWLAEGVTVGWP
jgi:hypothetical protein